MKGEMNVAPALAARMAWAAVKHSVTLTMWPSSAKVRQAFSPSSVRGYIRWSITSRNRPTEAV